MRGRKCVCVAMRVFVRTARSALASVRVPPLRLGTKNATSLQHVFRVASVRWAGIEGARHAPRGAAGRNDT